jgi:hypothetical protein
MNELYSKNKQSRGRGQSHPNQVSRNRPPPKSPPRTPRTRLLKYFAIRMWIFVTSWVFMQSYRHIAARYKLNIKSFMVNVAAYILRILFGFLSQKMFTFFIMC